MVVRTRRLAAELRRLREAAGLTLAEAGAQLECSASKISRIENGQVRVTARDVRDLLRVYGVPAGQQASLIQLARAARAARQHGWWQAYGSTIEPHLATYLGLEHAASEIRIYRVSRIPGLLQTDGYARSYFSAERPGSSHPGTEQSVALLTERQRQAAIGPPGLHVVLGEAALRQQPGDPGVLRGQLEHLTTLSTRPRTTIQVLPFTSRGFHLTIDGNFTIMGFPHPADPDLVCIGYPTGLLWIEDAAETGQYSTLFTRLQAAALPAEDSRAFLTSLLETL
jgi:transcriptional regulator with XRE-family HTH domain